MTSSLQDLLAVQDLDLILDQLRHRKSHLPEREELSRIDRDAADAQRQLDEVDVGRRELADRQAGAEAELAATEERSRGIDKRLYGGEVSGSRDLQAMSAELDHLKSRASALEDSVLEVMEASEPLERRAGELGETLSRLAARRAEVTALIADAERSIEAEMAEVAGRRGEAAAQVPQPLLATYERLRARLGGVGVARLVGRQCDGCHLTLSAVELDQVRHLPEGEIYTCEQCSRILVP